MVIKTRQKWKTKLFDLFTKLIRTQTVMMTDMAPRPQSSFADFPPKETKHSNNSTWTFLDVLDVPVPTPSNWYSTWKC